MGAVSSDYPQWFRAIGDNSHDDTAAIQSAIDACRGPNNKSWYMSVCSVTLPATGTGAYLTNSELRMFSGEAHGGYGGMMLCGRGKYSTTINYRGPAGSSAIHMIGIQQKLCDLHILNGSASGWLDGVSYNGRTDVGISTGGRIENVFVDCNSKPGNGITTGRGSYQADQLEIDHPLISGCTSGYAVRSLDRTLSALTSFPGIGHNWVGVASFTSANLTIHGGEIDDNDVNFIPGAGSNFLISGIRSEGSKKSLDRAVSSFGQFVTVEGYQLSSDYASQNNPPRQPATGGCSAGGLLALSNDSVTWGDFIVVAGAGPGGAPSTPT